MCGPSPRIRGPFQGKALLDQDRREILGAFAERGVEYLVVDACALAAHGLPRTTGDLDLLHWLDHYAITPIVVLTKADKVSRQETRRRHSIITRAIKEENPIRAGGVISHEPVIFSARTRQGRDEVLSHMKTVAAFNPADPREPHNP